jgi:hypothetical protein
VDGKLFMDTFKAKLTQKLGPETEEDKKLKQELQK